MQLSGVTTELLRLCAWLFVLIAIFGPLERLLSLHRLRLFRRGFAADLGFFFLNGMFPKLLVALLGSAVAWSFRQTLPADVTQWMGALPLWIRLPLALLVGEIGSYWGHRWSHEVPLLWRFHAVHHSAEEMDWLVNTRAHPVDMVFTRMCGLVPLFALGLVDPAGRSLDLVPILVTLAGTLWGFVIHANLRWRFGCLEWVISTPAFHHWHHTNDSSEVLNRNYSALLPFVDWIFGTWHLPSERWPSRYGSDTPVAGGVMRPLVQPFLPEPAKARNDSLTI